MLVMTRCLTLSRIPSGLELSRASNAGESSRSTSKWCQSTVAATALHLLFTRRKSANGLFDSESECSLVESVQTRLWELCNVMLTSLKMMRSTSSGTLAVRSPMRKDAILLQVESIVHTNRVVCIWKVG